MIVVIILIIRGVNRTKKTITFSYFKNELQFELLDLLLFNKLFLIEIYAKENSICFHYF